MSNLIKFCLRRVLATAGLVCGLTILPAAGQIAVTIQSFTSPSGTATTPHFVIDSDAANPDPAYNRNTIPAAVTVHFQWNGGASSTETYRAFVDLIGPSGNIVALAAGSTSASQTITLPGSSTSTTRTFSMIANPSVDLGAGAQYKLRYRVQRRGAVLFTDPFGNVAYDWSTVAGPTDSSTFAVVHFTDLPEDPQARYIRGYLMADPSWVKTYALDTSSDTVARSFRISVPYRQWRYDLGGVQESVQLRFTVEMRDNLGNLIPLESGGVSTVSFSRNALNAGTPTTPVLGFGTRTINFRPTGQLNAPIRTYRIRVRLEHLEIPATSTYRDNGTSSYSSLQRLLHFNGTLLFGTLATRFTTISNIPADGGVTDGTVNTVLNVPSGTIPGFPDYSFGSGGDLGVKLSSNGDATVASGVRTVVVAGGGDVQTTFGGIKVSYPGTTLRSNGIVSGSTVVHLPQGLGYTPARGSSAGRYLSTVTFAGRSLGATFVHSGTLIQATPADAWVFDEARPLLYRAASVQFTQAGSLVFVANNAEWVHQQAMEQLENQEHQTASMRYRLTNDGHLRYAKINSNRNVEFRAHADGSARTQTVDLDVVPGSFRTHFPKNTPCLWSGSGLIKIRNGAFASDSVTNGALGVTVTFDGTCAKDTCSPAPGSAADSVTLSPEKGELRYTPGGGIYAAARMNPKSLRWGIRGDATAAHRTDTFSEAEFHAPGHQLYESEQPLASSGPLKAMAATLSPASLLLAGHDAANHSSPVYFGSTRYRDGVGAYAGATMAVGDAEHIGASLLADAKDEYPYVLLEGVSKYYVRPSGVSGRHAAGDGAFDPGLQLYKYDFAINRFQLTFLSNENHKSWINGGVSVPYPSQFSQDFLGLSLTCTGALGPAEIDPKDAGAKPLAYWNGSFTPVRMNFAPEVGGDCYGPRSLSFGLVSGAANIPTPLVGSLAFLSSGNIAPLAPEIVGVDGRLGLPASLPLAGPGNERYQITPVSKLYFNDHSAADAPASGFVSFAARCGVPFFEDLKVHLMTSAQAGVPAPIYLTSGWKDADNQTHFSNTRFDASHRGFPLGTPVADYQTASAFAPRAMQSLFGVVPLNYPLKWSSAGRYFTSWGPVTSPLFVVTAQHQVDYLSPEHAEISFGAQYDGLPKINLVSAAIDVADAQIGAAQALTSAATSAVTDTLNQGIGELGDLVDDNMEKLLDPAVDLIKQQAIDPLYQAIRHSHNTAGQTYEDWVNTSSGGLKSAFDTHLSSLANTNSVKSRLKQLAAATSDASSLLHHVEQGVERGILAIDSVSGKIKMVNGVAVFEDPIIPGGNLVDGILVKIGNDRPVVQRLVGRLIEKLAPPELAALLTVGAGQLTAEVNAELNEILSEFDPTLDRVNESLQEARAYLVLVRGKLAANQDILRSFEEIIANASTEIDQIVLGIRGSAYEFIDRIADGAAQPGNQILTETGGLIDEFNKEEFVAFIRSELRDRLLASRFIQQIQFVLRQHLSEIDIAVRSAIDSGFGEVSRMCKELIKESLGPIDDSINGLLGDVGDAVGAGSLDGYAHIQGDTLRRLRIDAKVQFKIPEEMSLQAYFEMLCYDSGSTVGSSTCVSAGEQLVEVKLGALDVPLDWLSPELRADLEVRFAMQTQPSVSPKGIGGSLTMTGGELDFQSLKITGFAASVAVGTNECYLAASARLVISDYEAAGGIFFGRTCAIDPLLLVDPDVGSLLGQPPFTGAYVYGEAWIPISEVLLGIPSSCLFRISAGVGAGAFYFAEGPTFGGRMLLGVSGEALCIVSIRGEVAMTGVMNGGSLRFRGRGTLTGTAGYCPFCVNFRESATVTYQDGAWDIDY